MIKNTPISLAATSARGAAAEARPAPKHRSRRLFWTAMNGVQALGAEAGTVEDARPALESATGDTRAEVLGNHPSVLKSCEQDADLYRLIEGVAHDFNNLLGVIIGSAEMALSHVSIDDSIREDLMAILSAAERSAVLTRQLLAVDRKNSARPFLPGSGVHCA